MYLKANAPFFLLSYALITFAIILIVLSFLPKKISQILSSLIVALTIIFFIEGNFLNYNLGVLNGKEIDWGLYNVPKVTEIIIIVFLIFLALIFYKKINSQIKNIFVFLIAFQILQISYLTFIDFKYDAFKKEKRIEKNFEDILKFSKKDNVLILVLDSFAKGIFDEILTSRGWK